MDDISPVDGGEEVAVETQTQDPGDVTVDVSAQPDVNLTPDTAEPEAAQDDAPVIPEQYEIIEGSEETHGMLEAFADVAKDLGMTQEAFGKFNAFINEFANQHNTEEAEFVKNAQTEWVNTIRADKELGGAELESNVKVAKAALDKFGSDELKSLLRDTGLGMNPDMVRLLFRVGKSMQDDSFVDGDGVAPGKALSVEDILYPGLPKE